MASAVVMMIAGAVLNATAFSGSMYLVKTLSSKKQVDEEKIRHDKALEKYQHAMGEFEKKRQQYQDWLTERYMNKKIAESDLSNTDYAFTLYNKAHPNFSLAKPQFHDYYKPNKNQKQYELAYVGGGMLAAGYFASKII